MAVRTAAAQALDTTIGTLKSQALTYVGLGTGNPRAMLIDYLLTQLSITLGREVEYRASGIWMSNLAGNNGTQTLVDVDPLA